MWGEGVTTRIKTTTQGGREEDPTTKINKDAADNIEQKREE